MTWSHTPGAMRALPLCEIFQLILADGSSWRVIPTAQTRGAICLAIELHSLCRPLPRRETEAAVEVDRGQAAYGQQLAPLVLPECSTERQREATVDFDREGSSAWLAASGQHHQHQYTFDISSHLLVHSSIDWIQIRQLRSSLALLV